MIHRGIYYNFLKLYKRECLICFESGPDPGYFQMTSCEHCFCKECLKNYLSYEIERGNTLITCPAACSEIMKNHEIHNHSTNQAFERFSRLESIERSESDHRTVSSSLEPML